MHGCVRCSVGKYLIRKPGLLLPCPPPPRSHTLAHTAGKYGCFIGADDEHVAVMGQSGRTVAVFATASATRAAPTPLFTLALEGTVLAPGLAAPLFPGPPMTNVSARAAGAPTLC